MHHYLTTAFNMWSGFLFVCLLSITLHLSCDCVQCAIWLSSTFWKSGPVLWFMAGLILQFSVSRPRESFPYIHKWLFTPHLLLKLGLWITIWEIFPKGSILSIWRPNWWSCWVSTRERCSPEWRSVGSWESVFTMGRNWDATVPSLPKFTRTPYFLET